MIGKLFNSLAVALNCCLSSLLYCVLKEERITGRLVWDNVADQIEATPKGYIVFDDTVLDKNYSHAIELVRRQYSGNAHQVIKGIGVVTCVYVNPETDQFWLIDYRLYDPDGDGKSKLDHVQDMLTNVVYHKQLPFQAVLMDTWYATKNMMLFIESLQKIYYCPLKDNRHVDDSQGQKPYQRADSLSWSRGELKRGKTLKIRTYAKPFILRSDTRPRVSLLARGRANSAIFA